MWVVKTGLYSWKSKTFQNVVAFIFWMKGTPKQNIYRFAPGANKPKLHDPCVWTWLNYNESTSSRVAYSRLPIYTHTMGRCLHRWRHVSYCNRYTHGAFTYTIDWPWSRACDLQTPRCNLPSTCLSTHTGHTASLTQTADIQEKASKYMPVSSTNNSFWISNTSALNTE